MIAYEISTLSLQYVVELSIIRIQMCYDFKNKMIKCKLLLNMFSTDFYKISNKL